MEGYQKLAELGRGTFGSVSQYIQKADGSVVAIKRIKPAASKQGLDVPTLREIKLLTELKHPNIVRLHSAFMHKKAVHLVLEYMESDLEAVIRDRSIVLSEADVKSYMRMILSALAHCHTSFVVHRDVKPNNMLLAADGTLKLADFGLARTFGSPDRNYTHNVFARWYRPPELFFGALKYGLAIDVWAAGCVLAELLLREPWFPGGNDLEVLCKMFAVLGTPNDDNWPGCRDLPSFVEFQPRTAPPLASLFPKASADCVDLLSKLVALDPRKRLSAQAALQHRFFISGPPPTDPSKLPKPLSRSANPLMHNAPGPAPASQPRPREEDGAANGDERPPKRLATETGS